MFDDSAGRGDGPGGVPEWAFSGSVRLDAAASRVDDPGVGAAGRRLMRLPGGPGLASLITSVVAPRLDEVGQPPEVGGDTEPGWACVDDLDAGSLVELVAAFQRVAQWALAGAARAAVELSQRPETRPQWPAAAGVVAEQCTAATDLSLRLGITRHAARTFLRVGQALEGPMRQTGAALEAGLIDWDKARALVDLLDEVPLAVCVEVEAAVLPVAGVLTCPQLVRAAQRELHRVDHRDAAERHARARAHRSVSRPRVLPNGMAAMTAVLPAEAAVRLDACLQAAAVSARRGRDGRTSDQLRADALDALARTAWDSGWIGTPAGADGSGQAPAPTVPGESAVTTPFTTGGGIAMRLAQNAGRGTLVSVAVGVGTLLGLDDRPGELAGYGPIGADVARMLATEGTWRRLVVDEPSGALLDVDRRHYRPPAGIVDHVRARNRTCVFPTCSVPAASCQIDHTVPFPHGPTSVENLGPLCAQHHQLKTHGGFRLQQPAPGSFVVHTPTGHLYLQPPDRQPGVPSNDDISPGWDDALTSSDHAPARADVSDTGVSDTDASDTGVSDTGAADTATSDTATSDTATSDTATSDTAASDKGAASTPDDGAASHGGSRFSKEATSDDEAGPDEAGHDDQGGPDEKRGPNAEEARPDERMRDEGDMVGGPRSVPPTSGDTRDRKHGDPNPRDRNHHSGNHDRHDRPLARRVWPPPEDRPPPF